MKKFLCAILVCLLIVPCVASCRGHSSPTDTPSETDGSSSDTSPTDEPGEVIAAAELEKYVLVRPDGAGSAMIDGVKELNAKIQQVYGVQLTLKSDFYKEGVEAFAMSEYELLVGNTNRPETQEFLSGLRYLDYGYALVGKKLVIAGHTEETSLLALDRFISDRLGKAHETVADETTHFLYTGEYALDSVTINGTPIGEYGIVYASAKKNAENVATDALIEGIIDASGIVLSAVSDKKEATASKLIMIGDTSLTDPGWQTAREFALPYGSAETKYYIKTTEDAVWLSANSEYGFFAAVQQLVAAVKGNNGAVTLDPEQVGEYGAEENMLSIMSFNILTTRPDQTRIDRVVGMILKYMPDTVGVQEASPYWMGIFKSSELMTYYDCVGVGRNGGNEGEYSAIFYKKDKFDLIDSGTKWLSDTPDTVNTKYSDSAYPRIMTYALLEDKVSGKRVLHVNTHLDHVGSDARKKQITVLLNETAKLGSYPTVITGDFNETPGGTVYSKMTSDGKYADSSKVAVTSETGVTFPSSSKILDYAFSSRGNLYIKSYKVCNEKINGAYPSDHYPIYLEYGLY